MNSPVDQDKLTQLGKQLYQIVSTVALGVLVLTYLVQPGFPISRSFPLPVHSALGLLILAVGSLGIYARVGSAPIMVLLIMAAPTLVGNVYRLFQVFDPNLRPPGGISANYLMPLQPFQVMDVLRCIGILGFTLGHYRLQSLNQTVFPPDPRLRAEPHGVHPKPWPKRRKINLKRSGRLVTTWEIGLTLFTLPIWALLAQYFWLWFASQQPILGVNLGGYRFFLFCWVLLVPGLVIATFLRFWRRYTMTRTEAKLIVQDNLWQETRREQRRMSRWLAWWGIGYKNRKDKT